MALTPPILPSIPAHAPPAQSSKSRPSLPHKVTHGSLACLPLVALVVCCVVKKKKKGRAPSAAAAAWTPRAVKSGGSALITSGGAMAEKI